MFAGAPLPVIAGAVVLAAAGMSIAAIAWRSLVQRKIPETQQGRVTAWTEFGQLALMPITHLLVGPGISALRRGSAAHLLRRDPRRSPLPSPRPWHPAADPHLKAGDMTAQAESKPETTR
jgi:hypothetical protein